jgi:hypothetical protein
MVVANTSGDEASLPRSAAASFRIGLVSRRLTLALPQLIEVGEGPAERAIGGEPKAMGAMLLVGRVGHGAQGVVFRIQFGRRHNIVALVVGNVGSAMINFHGIILHGGWKIINSDSIKFGFKII